MKSPKYIILREDYFNEIGVSRETHFTIKEMKKFLWFKWWVYVKYVEVYESGNFKNTLKFKSMDDAEKFINDVLLKKSPRERWYSMVVKKIN